MKITVKDLSKRDNNELIELIKGFVPYTRERLGYKRPFSINLVSDDKNAQNPFGETAFYSPEDFSITLFVASSKLRFWYSIIAAISLATPSLIKNSP